MTSTHKLYVEGQITSQGFGQFYKPAEERLNQLLAESAKLEGEVAQMKVTDISTEEVLNEAKTLYDRWPTLDMEEKRKIAESIVEKIVVETDTVAINLSYLPSSEELCKSQQQMAPATC